MILKRLELHGFKSFAQKAVLEFPSKIVAVVGPNGSGKSNVIDALRWVLGEREAKQLRGLTLENLIFAGTPKRAQMGFAEVALHFDNAGGLFPVASSEVVLARRVDRTGVSQFSLNDEEIKLKDLLPILARAKLGTRGLTMIGQGQSTMFVEASPLERRVMIEEILGLKEFRLKKHDAERRLASSESNCEKVQAMIDELSPHLSFLRRQRKKWEKRSELADELKDLDNRYYGQKLAGLRELAKGFSEPSGELEIRQKQVAAEVKAFEERVKGLKNGPSGFEEAKKIRERLEDVFGKISDLEREKARLEVKIEYAAKAPAGNAGNEAKFRAALELAEGELERIARISDLAEVRTAIAGLLEKVRTAFGKAPVKAEADPGLVKQKEKIEKDITELQGQAKALRAEEEALASRERAANESFRAEFDAFEAKKNELRKIEDSIQRHRFEGEKLQLRFEEAEREWLALGRAKEELSKLQPAGERLDEGETERRMMRLRGQLGEVGEIDEAMLKEAEESETRHAFLERELADISSAIADLKKLIQDLDQKIRGDFDKAFSTINDEFQHYFALMFGGGRAKLKIQKAVVRREPEEGETAPEPAEESVEKPGGVEIDLSVPKKKITNLEMLSGGEKSLVSLAALFALIAVSPPPFLVLDEIDAALDEANARRFSELVKNFSTKSQFIIVTHNRATMEAADVLYGVTMADDGISKLLSLRLGEGLTEDKK
jgi:chromosome segregation protein